MVGGHPRIFLEQTRILCESTRMAARTAYSPGHVFAPSLWIGTISLVWVVGMDTLGYWKSLDEYAIAWTSRMGEGMRDVPAWIVLMMTVLLAYALPWLMLCTPHWWRRLVLWVSITILTTGWIPVLALASWKLTPAMPIIAIVWSGVCAFIYAQRHQLPCEGPVSCRRESDQHPAADI